MCCAPGGRLVLAKSCITKFAVHGYEIRLCETGTMGQGGRIWWPATGAGLRRTDDAKNRSLEGPERVDVILRSGALLVRSGTSKLSVSCQRDERFRLRRRLAASDCFAGAGRLPVLLEVTAEMAANAQRARYSPRVIGAYNHRQQRWARGLIGAGGRNEFAASRVAVA